MMDQDYKGHVIRSFGSPVVTEAQVYRLGALPVQSRHSTIAEAQAWVDSQGPWPVAAKEQSTIFRDHRCWKCQDGNKPCAQGHPLRCGFPHARND